MQGTSPHGYSSNAMQVNSTQRDRITKLEITRRSYAPDLSEANNCMVAESLSTAGTLPLCGRQRSAMTIRKEWC